MTCVPLFKVDGVGNTRREEKMGNMVERLLLWWVVGECDTLGDIALEALDASLQKGLFVFVEVFEWVLDSLDTGSLHSILV
jgi:hypothetical protein